MKLFLFAFGFFCRSFYFLYGFFFIFRGFFCFVTTQQRDNLVQLGIQGIKLAFRDCATRTCASVTSACITAKTATAITTAKTRLRRESWGWTILSFKAITTEYRTFASWLERNFTILPAFTAGGRMHLLGTVAVTTSKASAAAVSVKSIEITHIKLIN